MRRISLLLFVLLLFVAWIGCAWGQVETDTAIRGLVTDHTGAAVVGAAVMIRNVDTGEQRSTTADGSGSYSFPSVVPGKYDVFVTQAGFKKAEVKDRVAQVSQTAQVDFVLQLGDTSEQITVSAAGAELLSTSNAEIAATINSTLTQELPLNGRNFFDAAVNLPFVSLQDLGAQTSFAGSSMNEVLGSNTANPFFRSSGLFAAGNRDSATNVSIDGVNIQSSVYRQTTPQEPPSAIQEVKIHVSGMTAEFGNGVAAVNVITKGGSNEFHGELYEYLRNNVTDANVFFNNLSGKPKNPIKMNQFGGAVGGPMRHNKLFFFAAYEGLRFRETMFTTVSRPTPALEAGDFSGLPGAAIYDPLNYNAANGLRAPFPGNVIPTTRINSVAQKFDQMFLPSSNIVVDGLPEFGGNQLLGINSDQGVARVDYALSDKDRIYGRFSRIYTPNINKSVESLAGIVQVSADESAGVHWTRILSANAVNDAMVGYSRPNWAYGKDTSVPNVDALIGLVNSSGLGGGPGFSSTGYSMNSSNSSLLDGTDNVYQLSDALTLVRGRHNYKFGVELSQRRFYYPSVSNDKGSFTFSPVYTAACPDGNAACTTARGSNPLGGNAFASYLLGYPVAILFQLNSAPYRGTQNYHAFYAEDSWRVSGKLTVNYGLRYEHWSPWHVPRHTVDTFNEATGQLEYPLQNPLDYLDPSKGFGKSAPLNPNVPRDGYKTTNLNFGPRVGAAYTITPTTVIRAGYGIFFDGNSNTNQLSQISEGAGPFNLRYQPQASTNEQTPSISLSGQFPFPSATAIPTPNTSPLSTFRFVPIYDPPSSVQEWSASIQQRIGSDWVADISYQGTHALHLPQFVDVNSPKLPQGPLASLAIDARREFPWYGIVGAWKPIGYSHFEGIAGSVRNIGWHGITLISSYTFAKNIASSVLGTSDQGNQDDHYPYLWRGPAKLTPEFRFVNSFSYELPFASKSWIGGQNRYAAAALGGWKVSGIQDYTAGAWENVTTNDVAGTGYGLMPNRTCDARNVPGGRNRLEWFNTSCFVNPAFGTYGNSPLGVFQDPPIDNLNVALLRIIRLPFPKETGALRVRADFFNALNHTQWGPPSAATAQSGNTSFGRVLATRPARAMQFSLTYVF